jgi:hypothetical protein
MMCAAPRGVSRKPSPASERSWQVMKGLHTRHVMNCPLCARREAVTKMIITSCLAAVQASSSQKQLGATRRKLLFKLKLISPTIFYARIHFPRLRATPTSNCRKIIIYVFSSFLIFHFFIVLFLNLFYYLTRHSHVSAEIPGCANILDKALKQQRKDLGPFLFSPSLQLQKL